MTSVELPKCTRCGSATALEKSSAFALIGLDLFAAVVAIPFAALGMAGYFVAWVVVAGLLFLALARGSARKSRVACLVCGHTFFVRRSRLQRDQ